MILGCVTFAPRLTPQSASSLASGVVMAAGERGHLQGESQWDRFGQTWGKNIWRKRDTSFQKVTSSSLLCPDVSLWWRIQSTRVWWMIFSARARCAQVSHKAKTNFASDLSVLEAWIALSNAFSMAYKSVLLSSKNRKIICHDGVFILRHYIASPPKDDRGRCCPLFETVDAEKICSKKGAHSPMSNAWWVIYGPLSGGGCIFFLQAICWSASINNNVTLTNILFLHFEAVSN